MNLHNSISRRRLIFAVTALLAATGLTIVGAASASTTPTADPPGVRADGHSVDLSQVPSKAPALDANGDQLRDLNGNALCVDVKPKLPITPPTQTDLQSQVIGLLLEGGSITIGGTTYTSPTQDLLDQIGVDTTTSLPIEARVETRELTAADTVRCG